MNLLELAKELNLNPKRVASTGGGEWHAACPTCGGTDRFIIQPYRRMKNCEGSFKCRQCGIHGDAIEFAKQFLKLPFNKAVERVNGIGATVSISSTRSTNRASFPTIKAPTKEWKEKAASFVEWAHKELLKKQELIDQLAKRGLGREAIEQYKIGFCSREFFCDRQDWGLSSDKKENGEDRTVWLPTGIVIPSLGNRGMVDRLKIRRSEWKQEDKLPKYVAISGSMNGLNIIGNTAKGLMAVVESELDAFALHYACSDLLFCVAIGSNSKNADIATNYYAERKRVIVIPDNDEGGEVMRKKWTKEYPHAKSMPTPIGKDIGEAIEQGFNIREWILNYINETK